MVILGTGIDIIEVHRIESAVKKSERFLERVFTKVEIGYFSSRKFSPLNIAGTFAAKEAVVKALGTGFREMDWKDIEITRDEFGKPSVVLHNNAKTLAEKAGIKNIHISISHCRDYAAAQAVAEGD